MNTTRNYTTQYDYYATLTVIINGNNLGTMKVPDVYETMRNLVSMLAMTDKWKITNEQFTNDGLIWFIRTTA